MFSILLLVVLINYVVPNLVGTVLFLLFSDKGNVFIYRFGIVVLDSRIRFIPRKYDWVAGITFGNYMFIKTPMIVDLVQYLGDRDNEKKYIRNDEIRMTINHELCHTRQQLLFGLLFFVIYLVNFAINRAFRKGDRQAYLDIVFEKRARKYSYELEILYYRRLIYSIYQEALSEEKKNAMLEIISSKIAEMKDKMNKVSDTKEKERRYA